MTAARDDRSLAGGPLGGSRAMGAGHAGRDAAHPVDGRYGARSEPDGYETSGPFARPDDGARPAESDSSVFDIADDHRDGRYRSSPPSAPGHDRTGSYRLASEGSSMTYPPGPHGPPSGGRSPYPGSAPAAAPPPPFTGGRHAGSSSGSGPFGPIPTAPPPPPPPQPEPTTATGSFTPDGVGLPAPREASSSNDVNQMVSLIRSSWAAVAHRSDELGSLFYGWLFRIAPETRDLFPVTMELQRTRLLRALVHVVQMVDRPEELSTFLRQLGRDHRKFGVIGEHYDKVGEALLGAIRETAGPSVWTHEIEDAWAGAYDLVAQIMREAADAERGPAVWMGRVMEHRRISQDLAVVRVQTSQPVPYLAGQYVSVETPQRPRMWRSMSPANAPGPDCVLEFHVRTVPGGWVSRAIVSHARVGDVWRIGPPMGQMTLDPRSRSDLLMVAGGTGLAPARSIIEQLIVEGTDRKVALFVGGRTWSDLYDIEALRRSAQENPWLSVIPVVEDDGRQHGAETGTVGEVVARYGAWADREITVSGSPAMVRATVNALLDAGTPFLNIHYDPYHTD
ncbi:FAD-binding oxidoreductase [Actinomycetospora rhizophila]|uniref:nitric oxide dioxygenase n=1 Tax=Actinomycetospora rhizophila TaxID=1416876 RepID=A0ABV9Z838_9PSEU